MWLMVLFLIVKKHPNQNSKNCDINGISSRSKLLFVDFILTQNKAKIYQMD